MRERRFIQCDVFSPVPTQGNALAVVVDGEGLSDEEMQRFAAWTNLAETTFIVPPVDPVADYRLKIFTPVREMLFAGHPTLGSCAAWLHCGGQSKAPDVVRQECGVGIVEIDTGNSAELAFVAPPTTITPMPPAQLDAIIDALDIPRDKIVKTARLNNGPEWQALQLDCAQTVLAMDSSRVRWPAFKGIGLIGAHPAAAECDFEVRMLAPSSGMSEDPITGSLNAALAHWLQQQGQLDGPVVVAQGTNINRLGRVSVRPVADGGGVKIGGQTHVLVDGRLRL